MRQSTQPSVVQPDTCWWRRCSFPEMFAHSGTGHDGVRQWKQWMSDALNTSFGIAPNRLIAALSTSSADDAAAPASGVASCDCTSAFTASRSSSFPASE